MNILVLSWRDPKNPKSGGAEKLMLECLRPLIERGDKVTWYGLSVEGLKDRERYKGITIVRYGGMLSHFLALPYLLLTKKFGKVDFIFDCIHGIGYMANFLAPRTKRYIFICEVAQNIWTQMYSIPVGLIGRLWERVMLLLYRGSTFWTISDSSKKDLIAFGISKKDIKVLPMGFEGYQMPYLPAKYGTPTALFVGRLAKMKGIEDAILAMKDVPRWRLKIIGKGDLQYEKELERLVIEAGLEDSVEFLGFLSEKRKFEEMAKSWVLLVPSRREGWGMIVPEANSVGTPVIGYRSPGLVDSLRRYSKSNKIVRPTSSALAKELMDIRRSKRIKDMPKAGWEELYTFVLREMP